MPQPSLARQPAPPRQLVSASLKVLWDCQGWNVFRESRQADTGGAGGGWRPCARTTHGVGGHTWWTAGTTRGEAGHLGLTHTETQRNRLWTA